MENFENVMKTVASNVDIVEALMEVDLHPETREKFEDGEVVEVSTQFGLIELQKIDSGHDYHIRAFRYDEIESNPFIGSMSRLN